MTFNYVKAMSDFLVNFTFSKGVHFQTEHEFQHITPALLDRIWSKDNQKEQLLWEIGNLGSVQGDSFIKVSYEPPWEDAGGHPHPGRVKIMPINGSFCFPEWHPHDRERLLRFKLKYRFWGTAPEGTRQVYTYVEIITDEVIEEYVNDELIDRRANPLGVIPVVHIANQIASASPWGLSDVADLIPLNREYNEKATAISDIINYHVAPVTILTGGKANNLERGANKLWAIPAKDAKVYNLEGGTDALPHSLEFLEMVKRGMHEMTGIPENALGQDQEISNTSGVALSIQYMPLMMRYEVKKIQYGVGIQKINRLALMTLFLFEPEALTYNPATDGILEDPEAQPVVLDAQDPDIYETQVVFPPPLPVDELVKLNEIQAKMMLGLESKKGALRDLGEQFPDEKLQELQEEMIIDTKMQAAIDIIKAHIAAVTMALTGMSPSPDGPQPQQQSPTKEGETPPPSPPVVSDGALPKLPGIPDITKLLGTDGSNLMSDIITQAYGTKIPQRRIVPGPDDNN
ncbi:MAG TPA: phage portal protein [Puia sp.]|nr:phage portal protein [Puia sp.]